MSDALNKARAEYEKKRVKLTVSFHPELDAELLAVARSLPNFSGWVKSQLAEQNHDRNTQSKNV
jgi:hypothetical protein